MIKRNIKLQVFFALAIICSSNLEAQKISSPGDVAVENSNLDKAAVPYNGRFITIKGSNEIVSRAYVAGPEDAKAGILFVHDYFGISDAVKESVERLGALGYRVSAVDLYKGRSATTN